MWDRIKLIITEHPVILLIIAGVWIQAIFFIKVSKHGRAAKALALTGAILFIVLLIALVVNQQWMINIALGLAVLAFVMHLAIAPRRGD
jgi:hypothetical protein